MWFKERRRTCKSGKKTEGDLESHGTRPPHKWVKYHQIAKKLLQEDNGEDIMGKDDWWRVKKGKTFE